jgi:hypothetical protein
MYILFFFGHLFSFFTFILHGLLEKGWSHTGWEDTWDLDHNGNGFLESSDTPAHSFGR